MTIPLARRNANAALRRLCGNPTTFAATILASNARSNVLGPRRDGDDLAFRAGVAEELGDVVAHLGEGLAAQSPSLVEVVEPLDAGALVADGKLTR